jgi:tellurite resistance protein TehA-like permease
MSATAPHPAQPLVLRWLSQVVGTVAIAAIVYFLFPQVAGMQPADPALRDYIMFAGFVLIAPSMLYLRTYKRHLMADARATHERGGSPDPEKRKAIMAAQAIGGALSELPLAAGLGYLFFGGEMKWFMTAAVITLTLRLTYRPFSFIQH